MANPIDISEAIMSKINVGHVAAVVAQHLAPVLEQLRHDLTAELKNDFRSGKFDATKAQAITAQLVVLDSLENKLKSQINVGETNFRRTQPKETQT